MRIGVTITAVILVLALLGVDHFWYKPMKEAEQQREDAQHEHCMSTFAKIRSEGGDIAIEHRSGRLKGCDFGTFTFG